MISNTIYYFLRYQNFIINLRMKMSNNNIHDGIIH